MTRRVEKCGIFWRVALVVLALVVVGACAGDPGAVDPDGEGVSPEAQGAEPSESSEEPEGAAAADEPIETVEAECAPPKEFPEELPVPPCERTVGRIVRDGDDVTWIMVSSLPNDDEVKEIFDRGFASGSWQAEYLEGPYEGSYVLQVSGHGVETGTIRFGSNNITKPTVRYDVTLE